MFDEYTDDFLAGPEGVVIKRTNFKRENEEPFILIAKIEDDGGYTIVAHKSDQEDGLEVAFKSEFEKYSDMIHEYNNLEQTAGYLKFIEQTKWQSRPGEDILGRSAMDYLIEEYPLGSLIYREGEDDTRSIIKYSHRGAHIESSNGWYLIIVHWSDFLKYKKTKRQPE